MRWLKLFEDYKEEIDWNQIINARMITWIRETFFNRTDFVQQNFIKFEEAIDGMFERGKYHNPQLQLGIASDGSYECFFMPESKLIIDNEQRDNIIQKTIQENSGAKRFMEKVRTMQTRKSSPYSSIIYYPYYKFECSYSVDKETCEQINRNDSRYIRYCEMILKDLFPGWKFHVQMRVMINSVHFWVHLVDKTNVKESF